MKPKLIVTILILGISLGVFANDGIKFNKGSWSNVLLEAKKRNVPIFVDFYAVWCPPCKKMDREVFTDASLGVYFNDNFIAFKVDAEKEEEALVDDMDLEAYPTLGFFSPDGKLIHKEVGYTEAVDLIALGKKVKAYPSLRSSVMNGTASREQLLSFLPMAKHADEALFNQYAENLSASFTLSDILQTDAWELYTQLVTDINSKAFELAIRNAKSLSEVHENYNDYVLGVLGDYHDEVLENGKLEDLKVYKLQMQSLYAQLTDFNYPYEFFDLTGNCDFYLYREDLTNYFVSISKLVKDYYSDNAEELLSHAITLSKNSDVDKHLRQAIEWAEKGVELDRTAKNIYDLAIVYYYSNEGSKALTTAQELYSFNLSEDDRETVDELIARLK